MTAVVDLAPLVATPAAVTIGTAPRTYAIEMRNDFLTPKGASYKWQEFAGTVERTLEGEVSPPFVPMRYTWQEVFSRTGTRDMATERREWTFARGQGFSSLLLRPDARAIGAEGGLPPISSGMDITFPDLPKAPAVDLLLMACWDVLTMEMLSGEFTVTPELAASVGREVHLERLSGAYADLLFSDPRTSAFFRNSRMTATRLGQGIRDGRTVVGYSFQCFDCELSTRTGSLVQEGTSTYWGTLQIDRRTGEMVSADMVEMILATVTTPSGERQPVQKRRMVRMYVVDSATPTEADRVANLVEADSELLGEAVSASSRLVTYLRAHIGSFRSLPTELGSLTDVGFRSVVGADLPAMMVQATALRRGLRAWSAGDETAAVTTRAMLPAVRGNLEAFITYARMAVEVAGQLNFLTGPSLAELKLEMNAVCEDVAGLSTLLAQLEAETV